MGESKGKKNGCSSIDVDTAFRLQRDEMKMHTKWHLLVSLTIAAASLPFNQSIPFLTVQLFGHYITIFVLCIVVGVLIDVDHIVDFWLNRWRLSETLESRFQNGKMFVVFHGVENVAVLATLSIVFPFLIFPTASYTCHIVMDMYSNDVSFQAYFYTVRFGRKLFPNTRKVN